VLTIQFTRYDNNSTLTVPLTYQEDALQFDAKGASDLLQQDPDFIIEFVNWCFNEGQTFCTFDFGCVQIGEAQILIDDAIPTHTEVWGALNQ